MCDGVLTDGKTVKRASARRDTSILRRELRLRLIIERVDFR